MAAKLQSVATDVVDWVLGTGAAPTRPNATDCTIRLSTDTPNLTTGAFTEQSGSGYAAVSGVTFNAAVTGSASNAAEINFGTAGAAWTDSVGVVIQNSAGTTMLYSGLLTGQPIAVAQGETVRFAAGALTVTES